MKIAFAGFRHSHIFGLYSSVISSVDAELCGCFEENDEIRKSVEKEHSIEFNYKTYEEILNDENVEAVAIGDYYGVRGKRAIEALKAGKHVICDKPICTDLSELDEIERLSKEKNLQVCCMFDLRYMPQIEKATEIIRKGGIGKLVNISFTGQHCLDYGNRPWWYFEEGKHGGTINDIAIHGIDLIRFMTGKNLTKVNFAKTWNAYADKEPDFKDCGQFVVEMEDVSVMADVSYAAPKFDGILPTYWDFYFWGTEGMMKFNLASNKIHVFKNTEEIIDCPETKIEYLDAFMLEAKGIKTMMNTEEILESQRQVLKIQKAAEK